MTEQDRPEPVTETRGGKDVDWAKVKPGQDLPEKEPEQEEPRAQFTLRRGYGAVASGGWLPGDERPDDWAWDGE